MTFEQQIIQGISKLISKHDFCMERCTWLAKALGIGYRVRAHVLKHLHFSWYWTNWKLHPRVYRWHGRTFILLADIPWFTQVWLLRFSYSDWSWSPIRPFWSRYVCSVVLFPRITSRLWTHQRNWHRETARACYQWQWCAVLLLESDSQKRLVLG